MSPLPIQITSLKRHIKSFYFSQTLTQILACTLFVQGIPSKRVKCSQRGLDGQGMLSCYGYGIQANTGFYTGYLVTRLTVYTIYNLITDPVFTALGPGKLD